MLLRWIGIDHVGISCDFDGGGGNLLRVMDDVQRLAAKK